MVEVTENWFEAWRKFQDPPWHLKEVNPRLENNLEHLLNGDDGKEKENLTFLVPLCGKSVDCLYLYRKGFRVIGVEVVEKACVDFFKESLIEEYSTEDGQLQLYNGNFFLLTKEILGTTADYIWDRGSFGAIEPHQREMYICTLIGVCKPDYRHLLNAHEYINPGEEPTKLRAPNHVTKEVVYSYFEEFCDIKDLELKLLVKNVCLPNKLLESVYLLTPKSFEDEFWRQCWKSREIGWHKSEVNSELTNNLELLTKKGKKSILIPLCGKSLDLFHLYQLGYDAVGVELVSEAIVEFFHENKLEYRVKEVNEKIKLYQTPDSRLQIFCGNFFDMTEDILGRKVDCIWDRGCLVAIMPRLRKRYVSTIFDLLVPDFSILLSTVERDQSGGPPFDVKSKDVQYLYGQLCSISVLELRVPDEDSPFKFYKSLYHMVPKRNRNSIEPWQERWVDGKIKWHSENPQPNLVKFIDKFKGVSTVFVPLCGKSGCMIWLAEKDYKIIGVEGVPYIVEEFFKENGIEFSRTSVPEVEGFVYKDPEGKFTIYACDLFKMTPEILGGKLEAVYDRGSFEALDYEYEERYVRLMGNLIDKEKFIYLLNCYEYDPTKFAGPPRAADRDHIEKIFGTLGKVEVLEIEDRLKYGTERYKFKMGKFDKILYQISPPN